MRRERDSVKRTDSLPMTLAIALGALAACAALALALLTGADAEGKKKKAGPAAPIVTSTSQFDITSKGAVGVQGGRGKISVSANTSGGTSVPVIKAYTAKQGKSGKTKDARSAAVVKAKLTAEGATLLKGCTVDSLTATSSYKAKKGKTGSAKRAAKGKTRKSSRTTTLNRDLGACSVPSENPVAKPYLGDPIATANADRCDFLDPAVCLQPWPNDYFTVADGTTDTGRRLNLNRASMPANIGRLSGGVPVNVDPTDHNRGDGFSPGNKILLKVPEVQTPAAFNNSGLVPVTNLSAYDDPNQAVVVINADTGERHPIFSELDANPVTDGTGGAAAVNLIVRPARNFEEGERYIVALRNLKNASNQPVEPPLPFRVYRDRLTTTQAPVEARRSKIEGLISTLQSNGIQRSNLYMAWDFTVASEDSLSSRALTIRDDALDRLGDSTPGDGIPQGASPTFAIDSVVNNPNANTLRRVDGRLTDVPCYLNQDGCAPGSQFSFDSNGDVTWNPAFNADVPFRCIIPKAVVDGTEVDPARGGTYGHGLLGEYTQVNGQERIANEQNQVWCAVDWAGFANPDLAVIIPTLSDVSIFNKTVDRMQQGFVNFHYLGRAMIRPDGFNSNDAFKVDADTSGTLDSDEAVIDPANLYFEGISQGGIMGGALTAMSPDFRRSVLNVPAINYSTLLRRSVDSDEYFKLENAGLYDNYPNELERPLLLSTMQLLWDRGEGNGYAQHMTDDPLPNTPDHDVLLQLAYGDHQVSNLAAEVLARTIGASVHNPALDPGRHWEATPFSGIPSINFGPGGTTPFTGSALVYYDGGPFSWLNNGATPQDALECSNGNPATNPCRGSNPVPITNVAPRDEAIFGKDPHGYPRRAFDGLGHINTFLDPNGFILPCTDPGPVVPRPCYANGWDGP